MMEMLVRLEIQRDVSELLVKWVEEVVGMMMGDVGRQWDVRRRGISD